MCVQVPFKSLCPLLRYRFSFSRILLTTPHTQHRASSKEREARATTTQRKNLSSLQQDTAVHHQSKLKLLPSKTEEMMRTTERQSGAKRLLQVLLVVGLLWVGADAFQGLTVGNQQQRGVRHHHHPISLASAAAGGGNEEGSGPLRPSSTWKKMQTRLAHGTENVGKLVFGVGGALVAGFSAPQTVDVMKAVKDGRQDVGTALQNMVRPPTAEAFSLKSFSRRTLKEKLASVPCFLVCNQQGSPYLVPLETGFDVGVVFLDPADAEEMLQSMVQNPQTADARILVMGMDKGLELVQSEPRRNGNHMLVFQFCPSVQQLKNANGFRKVGWKAILDKKPDKWRFGFNRQGVRNAGIPVFYCPDLRIAKGREMVKPIFFSMEDLYYAWDRSTAGKHGATPGDVKTFDLLRVIEWMLNEPEQTRLVGFHASTQAQDYVEGALKVKGGKSRPIRAS